MKACAMAAAKDASRDESTAACWVAVQAVQTAEMMAATRAAATEEKPLAASWVGSSVGCEDAAAVAETAGLRDRRGMAAATAQKRDADPQAARWASEQVARKAARTAFYWACNNWAAVSVALWGELMARKDSWRVGQKAAAMAAKQEE